MLDNLKPAIQEESGIRGYLDVYTVRYYVELYPSFGMFHDKFRVNVVQVKGDRFDRTVTPCWSQFMISWKAPDDVVEHLYEQHVRMALVELVVQCEALTAPEPYKRAVERGYLFARGPGL